MKNILFEAVDNLGYDLVEEYVKKDVKLFEREEMKAEKPIWSVSRLATAACAVLVLGAALSIPKFISPGINDPSVPPVVSTEGEESGSGIVATPTKSESRNENLGLVAPGYKEIYGVYDYRAMIKAEFVEMIGIYTNEFGTEFYMANFTVAETYWSVKYKVPKDIFIPLLSELSYEEVLEMLETNDEFVLYIRRKPGVERYKDLENKLFDQENLIGFLSINLFYLIPIKDEKVNIEEMVEKMRTISSRFGDGIIGEFVYDGMPEEELEKNVKELPKLPKSIEEDGWHTDKNGNYVLY